MTGVMITTEDAPGRAATFAQGMAVDDARCLDCRSFPPRSPRPPMHHRLLRLALLLPLAGCEIGRAHV